MAVQKYSWNDVPPDLWNLFSEEIDHSTKLRFMRAAIKEGKESYSPFRGAAQCGAIIVNNGRIIGKGHRHFVCPTEQGKTRVIHAEQAALAEAGENAVGSDLYVTLEPCYERGNGDWLEPAEPCSILIPESGIERVVIGLVDSDPRTNGNGVRRLVESGVNVEYVYNGVGYELLDLVGTGKFCALQPSLIDRL